MWWDPNAERLPAEDESASKLIKIDRELRSLADVKFGLRVEQPVLAPTSLLLNLLDVVMVQPLVFGDRDGPALALVIWRADYQTSEHYLAWPRLHGCGIVLRPDLFDRLKGTIAAQLRFQDFILGFRVAEPSSDETATDSMRF